MAVVGAALGVEHEGLPQRRIGGELAGAAIDEAAARHHQLTGVARHRRRHRIEVGAHRRGGLKGAAHQLEGLGVAEPHSLDAIAALGPGQGVHGIAEVGEHPRHQLSADQGLGHHLGRQEQTLKQQPMQIEAAAPLAADAGGGKPAASPLHQLGAAGHIATSGGEGAAQILDQRTGHQVGPHSGGFELLHQLAIAVVDKHQATGLQRLHPLTEPSDRGHRQGGTPAVAAAALDQHHPGGSRQGLSQPRLIHQALGRERQFVVGDAELSQGAGAAAPQADHFFQSVVGAAGEREQPIARPQHPEEGCGDGMGAAHELHPHGGGLGLQHPGEHPVQGFAALVAVAVAAHRGEVLHPQALGREGRQHPLQPGPHGSGAGGGQRRDRRQGGRHPIPGPGGAIARASSQPSRFRPAHHPHRRQAPICTARSAAAMADPWQIRSPSAASTAAHDRHRLNATIDPAASSASLGWSEASSQPF